jgi:UPF0755 protein
MPRTQSIKEKISILPLFLISLLLVIGVFIVWMGVPLLAENTFGPAAANLTPLQKWNYSLMIIGQKNDLLASEPSVEGVENFTIQPGASVTNIAMDLKSMGLIRSWKALRNFIIYKGYDTQLKAGDFSLSNQLTAVQIAEAILSTYSAEVPFYIYPGWRAEEIAAALPTSGIEADPEAFLAVVSNPSSLSLPESLQGLTTLEGFLFPGNYTIPRAISPEELALTFIARFNQIVTPDIQTSLEVHGLSFQQAITLASIIQRETFDDNERSLMASVFYNRLAAGIKLETDPTVQYSLGYGASWGGWWKTPLAISDLSTPSEFNTYIIPGLPPAPIANPDLPSILAVASPAQSEYYYFRANCDQSGSHVFSRTFEEHLAYSCN